MSPLVQSGRDWNGLNLIPSELTLYMYYIIPIVPKLPLHGLYDLTFPIDLTCKLEPQ